MFYWDERDELETFPITVMGLVEGALTMVKVSWWKNKSWLNFGRTLRMAGRLFRGKWRINQLSSDFHEINAGKCDNRDETIKSFYRQHHEVLCALCIVNVPTVCSKVSLRSRAVFSPKQMSFFSSRFLCLQWAWILSFCFYLVGLRKNFNEWF